MERFEEFFETSYEAKNIIQSDNIVAKKNLIKKIGWNLFLEDKELDFEFKPPFNVLLIPGIRDDVQGLVYEVGNYFVSNCIL